MTRRGRGAVATGLVLLLSACGSTVPLAGRASSAGAGLGVGAPSTGAGTQAAPLPGTSGAGVGPGGAAARSTGGAAPAAVGPAPGTEAGGVAVHDGPGVSATTLALGIGYFQNANAANEAIGGKGVTVSDPTTTARAAIDAVNRAGGIAGRRVVPVYFGVDPQSTTPYATEAQAECAYFTEDHPVLAVVDGTQAVGSLARPCLERHGTAFVSDNSAIVSDTTAHEVEPDSITWDRVLAGMVPALSRQGWFSAWDKNLGRAGTSAARVGVVTVDRPELVHAVDDVLLPLLRATGHAPAPADVIRIAPPGGFADDGSTVSAIDNAVLKLDADGVDHVVLTDSNGSLTLLFDNAAWSQHYLPRYGGSSGSFWQTLLSAGDLRAQTLAGAVGLGWAPVLDVPFTGAEGASPNATRHRCLAAMAAAGLGSRSATVVASQLTVCDALFLLEQALAHDRSPVTADVLVARVTALSTAFTPGLPLGDRFAPGRRDGVGSSYDLVFDGGCSCFGYRGPLRSLGGAA